MLAPYSSTQSINALRKLRTDAFLDKSPMFDIPYLLCDSLAATYSIVSRYSVVCKGFLMDKGTQKKNPSFGCHFEQNLRVSAVYAEFSVPAPCSIFSALISYYLFLLPIPCFLFQLPYPIPYPG